MNSPAVSLSGKDQTAACAPHQQSGQGQTSDSVSAQGKPLVHLAEWQYGDAVKFSTLVEKAGERSRSTLLIPDAFFSLKAGRQRLFFFVEVDLGTEPAKTIASKCHAYYRYWQSGGFAAHFHLPQMVGFRVLFVAPAAKRAATLLKAAQTLPAGRAMFYVTEEGHIHPQRILGKVWRDGASGQPKSLLVP